MLRILPAKDLPDSGIRRVYANQAWQGPLLATAIMLGIAAIVLVLSRGPVNPLFVIVPVAAAAILAAIAFTRWRTASRPGNWLLVEARDGLYIQLRSYLNHHLPGEAPAVFIPHAFVGALCLTHEHRVLPHERGRAHDNFSYIDILFTGNAPEAMATVQQLLRVERRLEPPGRWLFQKKHHDYPVRALGNGGLRLMWDWVRPREEQAIALLAERYPVGPDREIDSPRWEKVSHDEKLAIIGELYERGELHDAVRLYRQLETVRPGVARQRLEELFGDL